MRDEYDFSNAKRAQDVPHLAKLQAESGKSRITLFLDNDVLAAFRERAAQSGKGYQTLINEVLRVSLAR
ncbi:BrnA antitoxin family protein [Methylovulum miyakonense]|uniref:BrnA antitoxin family protein n=1 Tax=Methylovulum miyakonense TaxID=645578 RepID=UPI00038131AF|nr:BrnA antitoxin family protein [Methylovulum miyakonense]